MFKTMKRIIEVFTAGCPACEPVVEMVHDLSNANDEVTIYNLATQCETKECVAKMEEYDIKRVPSVAVNGSLLNCCQNIEITKADLVNAGIGQN